MGNRQLLWFSAVVATGGFAATCTDMVRGIAGSELEPGPLATIVVRTPDGTKQDIVFSYAFCDDARHENSCGVWKNAAVTARDADHIVWSADKTAAAVRFSTTFDRDGSGLSVTYFIDGAGKPLAPVEAWYRKRPVPITVLKVVQQDERGYRDTYTMMADFRSAWW